MLKNIIQHSPSNNIFFVTLHLIHRPKELATANQHILQRYGAQNEACNGV